jgi:hypothetical protein
MWNDQAEAIDLQAVDVAQAQVGEVAASTPSSQKVMRPSRAPGVFALTMYS